MERKNLIKAFLMVLFVSVSMANADITAWNCAPDGDGGITIKVAPDNLTWVETSPGEYDLGMKAIQWEGVAHMEGDFTTDGADPKVRIIEEVENQTTFAWTGYDFYVAMTQNFTLLNGTGDVIAPSGWTWTITQPWAVANLPHNGPAGYMGLVSFSQGSGSAIPIGGTGDFGVRFEFLPVSAGTVQFMTEQVPTPEPAITLFLLLGLVGFAIKRR